MEFMQSKKDKRIWIFVFLVLALLAAGVVIMLGGKGEGYRIIKITEVSGQVSIVNNGIEYEAYPGMNLQENYALVTSADSYVRMLLDDDKYIKLEAGSRVVFEKLGGVGSGKTAIRLERGSMVNEITHPLEADESFVINTPNAILAVRGTLFRVNLDVLETGETITNVYTYGGKVASNRIMPDGEVVEEDVMIDAGYKAIINMREEDTIYVVDEDYSEKEYTMPISEEDISDEDMVDIHFSAENGHELFISTEEAQTYIEERNINLTEQISVYEMAAELEQKSSVPDDKRPLISTEPSNEEYQFGAPTDGGKTEEMSGGVKELLCALIGHMEAKGGSEDCHTRCRICGSILSVSHSYTDTVTKEATTTTKGEITHSCDCGYSYTSEIPALASSETDNAESADNTESTGNTEVPEDIEISGNTGNVEITDVPNTGNNQEIAETVPNTTDGNIGIEEGVTEDIPEEEDEDEAEEEPEDEVFEGEITETPETDTPHTHSYTETITRAATCTVAGETTHSCICGYSYTTEIPATGHTEENGGTSAIHTKCSVCDESLSTTHSYTDTVTRAATCTVAGETTHSCTCGYSYTSEIAATGHTEVDGGTELAHTKCNVCGEPLSTAHSYTDTITTAAGCTTVGETTHSCTCGYSYTSEIPATGHTEENGGTSAIHAKCSVCGETLSTTHSYTDTITRAATCTVAGETTHSCTCGYSYTSEIAATGHTEVDGGTELAHTKCSVCDEPLSTTHSYTDTVTRTATCTVAGETTHSCTCGYSYTSEIAATGHTEVDGGTELAHTKCNVCGEPLSTAHSYTDTITTAAGCTTVGETTHSCTCGYSYTTEIPALGHQDAGDGTCSTCGAIAISVTNFPDVTFMTYVGAYDSAPVDNYLSASELENVTTINLDGDAQTDGGISDLTGIEYFSELTSLSCSYNAGLTSLNLQENTKLENLICSNTGLASLDMTYCTKLTSLDVSASTSLTDIDVSNSEALTTLKVNDCTALTSLTASGCTKLENLDNTNCTNLTGLNLSGCEFLQNLQVSGYTKLEQVDVSGCFSLQELNVNDCTELTKLSISDCRNMLRLYINNTQITDFVGGSCQSLMRIYANAAGLDDEEIAAIVAALPATVEYLDFGENTFTTLNLNDITSLQTLNLADNTSLTTLNASACTELVVLNVNNCGITSLDLQNHSKLGTLEMKNYQGTALDASGLTELAYVDLSGSANLVDLNVSGCTSLKELNITDCTSIQDLDISNLPALEYAEAYNCSSLVTMDVSNSGVIVVAAGSCPVLQTVTMDNVPTVVAMSFNNCPSLSTIVMDGMTDLEQVHFIDSGITSITVNNCKSIRDDSIIYIENCENLTSFVTTNSTVYNMQVTGCANLEQFDCSGTEAKNVEIIGSPNIKNFAMDGTNMTTFAFYDQTLALESFSAKNCPLLTAFGLGDTTVLQTFDVSGCTSLTGFTLKNYTTLKTVGASGCTALTTVDVSGCTALTTVDVSGCSVLNSVNLSSCTALTDVDVTDVNGSDAAVAEITVNLAGTLLTDAIFTKNSNLTVNVVYD